MSKLFVYDLETTGVKYWQNGIHQISGAIIINGEIMEKFNYKVKPYHSCKIEEDALKIANVSMDKIMSYPEMKDIYRELVTMLEKYVDKFDKLDKFHLVGYNNASFDNQFFRAFFVQNGDNYFGSWFWSDSIDVMILASYFFRFQRSKFTDFKQKTVAKMCGIEVDENRLHDAEYDIELCLGILNFITNKTESNFGF
jgi:DNA polymerase-3 subunit epsilon